MMENFVVSARKYRPVTFTSVVGQGHITSTLKNAISRRQLAHAYLFCGPRGVGKTTCARIFAKAINCLSPVDSEGCGVCESCVSFNEGRSFSIHELDAASNNSVDDIRSLTEQVRVPPQIGRYSVYIIDEVHMLSQAAFNAFLKTLEEPPAHAIFILATTEKHKIIPTILSRCQIFDFNRIRVEDTVSYLRYIAGEEGVEPDDESLHLIALKADGGMRDALSMFDKAVSFCGNTLRVGEVARTLNVLDYDTYFGATTLILDGDYAALLRLFDTVLGRGFSGQLFMAGLAGHLRDLLMCKNSDTLALLEISGSILERYKVQAALCEAGFLFEAIALLTSVDGTLRTSSSQRLAVELALMRLCSPAQKKNSDGNLTSQQGIFSADRPGLPVVGKEHAAPPQADPDATLVTAPGAGLANPVTAHTAAPAPAAAVPGKPSEGTAEAEEEKIEKEAMEILAAEGGIGAGTKGNVAEITGQTTRPAENGTRREESDRVAGTASTGGNITPVVSISGSSIASIMKSARASAQAISDTTGEEVPDMAGDTDPDSEAKIKEHMALFLAKLQQDRPRIAMAMREMTVSGSCVSVAVPNRELQEDIERSRTELLMLLAATASVDGRLELRVTLNEKPQGLKPIKPEDKYNYLMEKNPLLSELKRELDLDMD